MEQELMDKWLEIQDKLGVNAITALLSWMTHLCFNLIKKIAQQLSRQPSQHMFEQIEKCGSGKIVFLLLIYWATFFVPFPKNEAPLNVLYNFTLLYFGELKFNFLQVCLTKE